jgi:hypothetical protein
VSVFKTNPMMAKLAVHYGLPDKDAKHAEKVAAEYARLMSQYSDHELREAADLVLTRHRYRTWPSVAECISALEDYRRGVREKNAPEVARKTSYPEWSSERIAKADNIVNCALGRRAAAEGWVLSLHDFARKHERLPTEREIPTLIQAARFVDRFLAEKINRYDLDLPVPPGPELQMSPEMQAKHRAMAKSFIARREAISRKIMEAA